ncbi:MAG: MotA/TolQ/ExbB proton channel family protein, partial [Proteobacteria bacterium]
GTGDPKLMAGGISQALVTTVLGLCVAIPTVLMHTLVASRARRVNQILEEQATGMIAQHSERQRRATG